MPSLRLWLQSTTLLAVIAGYALLLGVNRLLNQAQGLDDHRQLVETLQTSGSALEQAQQAVQLFVRSLSWSLPVQNRLPCSCKAGTHVV